MVQDGALCSRVRHIQREKQLRKWDIAGDSIEALIGRCENDVRSLW